MSTSTTPTPDHEVVVIGAGFSGIGAAKALADAGIHDVSVLEAGDGVGGAWHWNTYPGVAVDIPSFSYQFSYRQRAGWSRVYAPGQELKAYAEDCVDRYGLRDRIRLNTKVATTAFDDDHDLWRVTTDDGGEITARHVIGATGIFNQPQTPAIPGLDTFAGPSMHTARWDHDVDLAGKRVAVVGTGASAVQVIPAIAEEVGELVVFQRTPIWCLPKPDARISKAARTVLRRVPGARRIARAASQAYVEVTFPIAAQYATKVPVAAVGERLAKRYLKQQVQDPETRAKLTPTYTLGCKRPSFHNDYLATFNREDVTLQTSGIAEVTPTGLRTVDGTHHEVDVLILATGFKAFERGNMPPYGVRGVGGKDLEAFWTEHRFQAYEGVSVPGFPNLFSILGPYGYNGASYFTLIENQMRHIVRCLTRAREQGATRVEITEQANTRYFDEVLRRRDGQVFFQGGCGGSNSYYFDAHGDVPFRPSTTVEAAWRAGHFDLDDYAFGSRVAAPAPAGSAAA
ncbi:flavin-containing monooxygenase [Patulibacter minatonensis]|uniref:flavin-containing monooxygenase n=1 Tax=Patulibacter minatonensis TaxID=298163 RepID=UPI0004792D9A|nr:NAD(P)/FAD-dependent oxidoreductase [Patulibacter minatonensis]